MGNATQAAPLRSEGARRGDISATGTERPAPRRRVAIRRPGWTAGRISLTRSSPRKATVRSRSGATKASPQKKAGRSPPCRSVASGGSWTTSRIVAPRRKKAWRGAPAGVGSSRTRRRSRPAAVSAATVRSRSEEIATTWSRPVTPFGCSTGSDDGERVVPGMRGQVRPVFAAARRQTVEVSRLDPAQRPPDQAAPALPRREAGSGPRRPRRRRPRPRTRNRARRRGASATVSSSRTTVTRQP